MTRIKILHMFYIFLYNFTYFYTFYMRAPHTLHKPRAQQTRSCHTSWRSRDSGARLMKSSRHNLLPSTTRVPPSLPNQKRSHLFQFPDTKFEIMWWLHRVKNEKADLYNFLPAGWPRGEEAAWSRRPEHGRPAWDSREYVQSSENLFQQMALEMPIFAIEIESFMMNSVTE